MNKVENMPALKFTILFASGILIGSQYLFNTFLLLITILILIVTILIFSYRKNFFQVSVILLYLIILLTGIYKSNLDFYYLPENSIRLIPDTKQNSSIILTGIIKNIPGYDTGKIKFTMASSFISTREDTFHVSGDVIIEIRKNLFSKTDPEPPLLEAGDSISVRGKLSEATGKRNPGEFDYRKYLEIQNIHKLFYVNDYKNVTVVSKYNLNFFYQNILMPVKTFVLNTIDENYTGDEAAYLKGLITGERSDITQEMKDDFVNAGVMHLIAVSGLNVAYIIISLSLILSLFRIPLIPRTMITIAFLIFYCMFTGNTASIIRASIMGILVLIAIILERRINFNNIIGMAAMMILIYDAKQLFDPGFILSFSATLSMAVFLTTFEKAFLCRIRELNIKGKKISLILLALFFTSLAAQIGTIPITANYFGKISVISLLANIITVPLANLSLAIGFFQMCIAAISDQLSSVISETNGILLHVQLNFIQWCASLDFAYFSVENFNLAGIFAYYLTVLILIVGKTGGNFCFRIILCGLVICGQFLTEIDFEEKLKITFLDVGQGDCSVIHTPDNKVILVDCGRTSFVSNSGERIIAPYLRRNGISKIDLLIITHLHLDHIGGINYLLENFEIGKIIESGQKYNTAFTNTMDSLIQAKNIPRETIRTGDYINNIENLRLYFLFPGSEFVNQDGYTLNNNLNNGSVAFILMYKENEFFFSGDIEKESENFICTTYSGFLETDVLKVAHHGSITSSTIKFIVNNKPEHAVISCGMHNKFNHPSDLVLNRLNNIGAVIHRTDTEGAVMLQSDGRNIEVIDW